MKKALNKNNKLINILESVKSDTYTCPICNEILTRNFGPTKQYFSHPSGKGNNCELKIKIIEDSDTKSYSSIEDMSLEKYYNKTFDNVKIELSDYMSNEGYYLTKEQLEIIKSTEDRIKVSALSGSAKTSTLYYYAKERPFKKILYLVYNRAMKDEAEKTFGKLKNVQIRTIHSLAFGYVGQLYKHKLTFKYNAVDVIKDLNLNWGDMELAVKINALMNEYMLSETERFEDLDLFKDENGKADDERDLIIRYCYELWELKKQYKSNVKIEHDFYLKCFQLLKKDLSHKFDILMLDESQDSNRLVLDIINSSKIKGVVLVGDKFQQLYGFRKAQNIMPEFEGKKYKLTTSFRVSQNIANIANMIVEDIAKETINMKGFNTSQRIVPQINKSEPYVCLCRTNAFIFAEVFEVLKNNRYAKLFFEGGYSGYSFSNIKDAYYFHKGHKVKNPLFNKFEDYHQMIMYAYKTTDLELLALEKLIFKYGSKIPDMIDGIKNNTTKSKELANVIFSTVHRSKGQTYSIPVYISDDHFEIMDILMKEINGEVISSNGKKFNIKDYYEEMCILYVAITRCAGEIELSEKVKDYLLFKLNNDFDNDE